MASADTLLAKELENLIAHYRIRIQQQRIHARELSGDPTQQKHARTKLAAVIAGLARLEDLRKHFT